MTEQEPIKKRCTACGDEHPATSEFFPLRKRGGTALRSRCKTCTNAKGRHAYHQPEVHARRLAHHKAFYHQPEVKIRKKAYRNRPEVRRRKIAYLTEYNRRLDRQEQRQAYFKEYNARPERKERQRVYANRLEVREHKHVYNQAYNRSSDGHIHVIASKRNRKARKKLVLGSHSPAQIRDMLQRHRYRCYFCRTKLRKDSKKSYGYDFHVEHTFPLSRVAGTDIPANDISYLVPACPTCNSKKKDKSPWEWPEGGRLL